MAQNYNVVVAEDGETICELLTVWKANSAAAKHFAKTGEAARVERADGKDAGLEMVGVSEEGEKSYHMGTGYVDSRVMAKAQDEGYEVALLDLQAGEVLAGPTGERIFDPDARMPTAAEARERLDG